MKLYKSLFIFMAAVLSGMWMTGCSDDDTLEGAKEVYIDIFPESIVLSVGDTLPISATVTNTAGKTINTPVSWSLDDESVVVLVGDTAITCITGALERGSDEIYTTKLRATLTNGKYAIAEVQVDPSTPDGVTPEQATYSSYNVSDDVVWFIVSPKSMLEDYEPEVTLSNENITLLEEYLVLEKETGRVGVRFASSDKSGQCEITLSVGGAQGSCLILLHPFVESSLWDPNDSNYPRMKMGELAQYRTFALQKVVDVNSTSYAYAGVNVPGGVESEIREAMSLCKWEAVSGNSVLVTEMTNEFLPELGYDAILRVTSGAMEGTTVFNYISTDTILEVTFMVMDFKKQPVDEITTNAPADGIQLSVNGTFTLETGVIPETSFIYHRPVVTAEDPTMLSIGEYDGNQIEIKALRIGETNLILTANGKTLKVPVKITEGISRITFNSDNVASIFVGQSVEWAITAVTTSGGPNPYNIEWSSSDNAVATVVSGSDPLSKGMITAVAGGKTDIKATIAGTSNTASLNVIALPDNPEYTAANTSEVRVLNDIGNTGMEISLIGPSKEVVSLLLVGKQNQFDFNVDASSSDVILTYNGARVKAKSGWARGTDLYPAEEATIVSFELTFEIGGKTFILKGTDLKG